jgi:hypothetical protein
VPSHSDKKNWKLILINDGNRDCNKASSTTLIVFNCFMHNLFNSKGRNLNILEQVVSFNSPILKIKIQNSL